jgi:hypothetical protein
MKTGLKVSGWNLEWGRKRGFLLIEDNMERNRLKLNFISPMKFNCNILGVGIKEGGVQTSGSGIQSMLPNPFVERLHRREVGIESDPVAGNLQRRNMKPAAHDPDECLSFIPRIEVSVEARCRLPFAGRAVGEALYIMMSVTFEVGKPESPHRGQILLKGHDRDIGEVFPTHEEFPFFREVTVPSFDQGPVQE